jgi:hypothetical protein
VYELLAKADPAILEKLYEEHRAAVVRSVMSIGGGSFGDGAVFFRTALVEAARQAAHDDLPNDLDWGQHLQKLAMAHYFDWKAEKFENAHPDEIEHQGDPEYPADQAPELTIARMRETRAMIFAHRKWTQLPQNCKSEITLMVQRALALQAQPSSPCSEQYLHGLGNTTSIWEGSLPTHVVTALSVPYIKGIREQSEKIESRLAAGQSAGGKALNSGRSGIARLLFLVLSSLLLGFIAYSWIATKPAQKAYNENFDPPQSLIDDSRARLQAIAMLDDSIARPERPMFCEQMIADADEHYNRKDYRAAIQVLVDLAEMPDAAPCSSDAYFYLGIVGLRMEEPELTLQVFAKIEDLDRFGDDIFWFQALAYVKMAENDPSSRETAVMALERALSNTDNDARKARAGEMIEKLR